jgi:16S rRNA (guanine527-N7)-methyltransferase
VIVNPQAIAKLLEPYTREIPEPKSGWALLHDQLGVYLELILKWNVRTNLTAIRTPDQVIQRHFGESLFAGAYLGDCATLLDFGSGAGFPGIPIQLLRPELQVTLGESQGKKATFLREVCRELKLPTEVFAGRIESMPTERMFDVVTLRAVDNMDAAIEESSVRARLRILALTTSTSLLPVSNREFEAAYRIPLPLSETGVLEISARKVT